MIVYSLLASGMITPWFLAPMLHCMAGNQCQLISSKYLNSLPIGASSLINVLASGIPSYETDCTDVGVITDEVDSVMLPMDHIHHSIRAAWKGTLVIIVIEHGI